MLFSLSCEIASPIAGVTPPFGPNSADHVLAAFDQLDDRARGDVGSDVDADIVRAGVDLEVGQHVVRLQRLQRRLEGRRDAVVDLDIADRHGVREKDRAALDVVLDEALDDRLAADRRRARVLPGVADVAAVEQRPVKGIGRGDDDALLLELLHDIVVGAHLRRRHDHAVDGGVVDDLVEDLDFARNVVDRRFRPEA